MSEPLETGDAIPVDIRHAGSTVFVSVEQNDDLFAGCVRLEMPGANPVPIYPREAREFAAALIAAADHAEQKNAPEALQRDEGDDQNPSL